MCRPLGRWRYTLKGAGEVFSVVRPEMSKEMERRMRDDGREIRALLGDLRFSS
jgi:hypothetical protein